MNDVNWIDCETELPPEGVAVNTLSSGMNQQILKRKGRLWFLPDMSMYVYYVPIKWAKIPEGHGEGI